MRPYLAVVAIVKNEQRYIREWLAFHELVGVERFYIFNNGSDDQTADILAAEPNVVMYDWPGPARQLEAYSHALSECEADWLAFIDADEYLYSPTYQPVSSLLRQLYVDADAVGVCWAMFGTSHQRHADPDTLGRYRMRADSRLSLYNRHVKSIVQPARVRSTAVHDPHHFDCDGVDEQGRQLHGPFAESVTFDLLKINHYHARSIDEAALKMLERRADTNEIRGADARDELLNAIYDDSIMPYAQLLEGRLRARARRSGS